MVRFVGWWRLLLLVEFLGEGEEGGEKGKGKGGGGEGYKFFWGGLMSCLRIGGWKLGFGGGGGGGE